MPSVNQRRRTAPEPPEPPDDLNTFSLFIEGGGFLGVYGEDINNENMGHYRLNQARGVGITRVVADSPAEKAGLRKDDVILRLDGENVTSVRKLNRLVSEIAPDHSVKITISLNGVRITGAAGPTSEGGREVTDAANDPIDRLGKVTTSLAGARQIRADLDRAIKQLEDAGWTE